MLRRWTGFETYCRNLHIDVHVPFRGFTLVRCKPGAAYQGLVPESMLVFKCQGLVSYFATRMHACRFSYSTHRFWDIESGPSISNVSKVDRLSNLLSKSVNLRAGSGAASSGINQTLMHYFFVLAACPLGLFTALPLTTHTIPRIHPLIRLAFDTIARRSAILERIPMSCAF